MTRAARPDISRPADRPGHGRRRNLGLRGRKRRSDRAVLGVLLATALAAGVLLALALAAG